MVRAPRGLCRQGPGLLVSVQTGAEQPLHFGSLGKDALSPQWDEPQARIISEPFPRCGGGRWTPLHTSLAPINLGGGSPSAQISLFPGLGAPHARGRVEGAVPSLATPQGLGGSGGTWG